MTEAHGNSDASFMSRRPRLLDLFCGGGGAGAGYHQAGFDVIGVDVDKQPHYPYEFFQADALDVLDGGVLDLYPFDVIHASPPCQGYSKAVVSDGKWTNHSEGVNTPRLISEVRRRLVPLDRPYIIENVIGAESSMLAPNMLCGIMFGRPTPRHRLFETNWPTLWPSHPACRGNAKRYAEQNGIDYRDMSVTGKSRRKGSIDTWRLIMEMPWAGRARDLSEAIYPAYANWIGSRVLDHLRAIEVAA